MLFSVSKDTYIQYTQYTHIYIHIQYTHIDNCILYINIPEAWIIVKSDYMYIYVI